MADLQELKKQILDAAEIGVEELIKVLKDPIIDIRSIDDSRGPVEKPDPEKMKTAAQAKRSAFEDALAIVERLQEERNKMDDSGTDPRLTNGGSFAELNAKKNDRKAG